MIRAVSLDGMKGDWMKPLATEIRQKNEYAISNNIVNKKNI
jgi:hypothetical protein